MKQTMKTILIGSLWSLIPAVAMASPAAAPPSPPPTPPAPQVHTFSYSFGFGHGRLGVQVSSMTQELRKFFGAPDDAGILVQRVEPGSAAADAGLKVGDVIVEVDGDPVREVSDVRDALSDRVKGDRASVTVVRGHKRKKLAATMTNDPMGGGFPLGASPFGGSGGASSVPFVFPPGADPELEKRIEQMQRRLDEMERQFEQQRGSGDKKPSRPPRRRRRSAA